MFARSCSLTRFVAPFLMVGAVAFASPAALAQAGSDAPAKPKNPPQKQNKPTLSPSAAPSPAPAPDSGVEKVSPANGTGQDVPPWSSTPPANAPQLVPTQSGPVAEGKAVVEFDPPIANLGEMIAGEAKSMTIKIRNISDQTIRITQAVPGCGCTTPVWPKEPIAPGAFGECEITMRPGDKAGITLSKKVTFVIENQPSAVLTVEGQVVAFVSIAPEMLEQPVDMAASPASPLTLESLDGTAFKITEITPAIVRKMPTEAALKHVLEIDWAAWEESGRQKRVVVKTDHPKAAQLTSLIRRSLTPSDAGQTPPTAPKAAPGPGTTELITAVRASDLSKVQALIAGGANVNEQDRAGGRTALHWAAKGGNKEALEALFAAKADPNLKDRQGRTPIWGAVETFPEIVKYLVEKGADINVQDQIKSTPLLWAAGFGRPETVAYLIERGANVKSVDDNGWTPLIWAAGLGQPQTVETLVKAGADLAAADRQTGDTPLLRAARTGKPESMKILLDAGADVTVRNKLQMTALHLAAQSGSADKVALLLAAKADPAAVDARNFTALDHAMARTTGDKTKLIEILKPVSPVSKPTGADAGATTEKKSQ
jgi:ankyrin repeat protein